MKNILSVIYSLVCLSTSLLIALGIITGTNSSCERIEQVFPEKYWWAYFAIGLILLATILIIECLKPRKENR